MRRLGLLCEYFIAGDDSLAASVSDWPSGPAHPPEPRGWRRRRLEPLPTVHAGSIEPIVLMAILEGLLTGADDGDLTDRNAARQVAEQDGGQRMIFGTADGLIDALSAASDDRLASVAVQWADAEEFGGMADPAELRRGLTQLATLAREARRVNARVYCWMSL
jgi:hypothetical protein